MTTPAATNTTSTFVTDALPDNLICEAVARQGGYEEVDQNNKWGAIAGALGKKKSHAPMIKARHAAAGAQVVAPSAEGAGAPRPDRPRAAPTA